MSPADKTELLALLWALVDQTIEPHEHARLEQLLADPQARQTYALYMGMVQRLDWDRVALRECLNADPSLENRCELPSLTNEDDGNSHSIEHLPETDHPTQDRATGEQPTHVAPASHRGLAPRFTSNRFVLRLAASILLVLATGAGIAYWNSGHAPSLFAPDPGRGGVAAQPDAEDFAATLTGVEELHWAEGSMAAELGARLREGKLTIDEGLAEITFDHGAKVVVEGPAVFEVKSKEEGVLHNGKLLAIVPPEAKQFALRTPNGTVVKPGHECGMIHRSRGTEVFAFRGSASVRPHWPHFGGRGEERVSEGETISITDSVERRKATGRTPFVRDLSAWRSQKRVEKMRELVAAHPALIHHYTFEGDRYYREQLQDKKGTAVLQQFDFGAGSERRIRYEPGLDGSTMAFRPHRPGPTTGGAALKTRERIEFPPQLTVECLVRPDNGFGPGYAVCARVGREQRGYFVRKSDKGPFLGTAIGSTLQEVSAPMFLAPWHWYYVATTCERKGESTLVIFYIADVTAGQSTLTQGGGQTLELPGVYPELAELRIGAGALSNEGAVSPFAGVIDEVALYSAVLSKDELEQRVKLLVADTSGDKSPSVLINADDQ
jgi:hypothetical protein